MGRGTGTHLDGVGGVDGDLVIRGVTVGQAQVIVLKLHVHIGEDELRRWEGERGG